MCIQQVSVIWYNMPTYLHDNVTDTDHWFKSKCKQNLFLFSWELSHLAIEMIFGYVQGTGAEICFQDMIYFTRACQTPQAANTNYC